MIKITIEAPENLRQEALRLAGITHAAYDGDLEIFYGKADAKELKVETAWAMSCSDMQIKRAEEFNRKAKVGSAIARPSERYGHKKRYQERIGRFETKAQPANDLEAIRETTLLDLIEADGSVEDYLMGTYRMPLEAAEKIAIDAYLYSAIGRLVKLKQSLPEGTDWSFIVREVEALRFELGHKLPLTQKELRESYTRYSQLGFESLNPNPRVWGEYPSR